MMTENSKKEAENFKPLSNTHKIIHQTNTSVLVKHKYTLGDMSAEIFSVRYDPNDKYIAAGCGDGSIRIFNLFTGKMSYILNTNMKEPMPTTSVRWRPATAPSVTKNVLISVNANGSVQHWHTTSGKLLNTIYDEFNQLYCADYKPDGTMFATSGKDQTIRVYDEATRKLALHMTGNATNQPGHSNRVFSVKFDKEDENILVSGGWDNTVQIWDMRAGGPVRSIYGPYICGDGLDISEGYILSGSWRAENQLQVWDLGTCELMDTVDWDLGSTTKSSDPCFTYSAQFLKTTGNLVLAGGSVANEAKLFDRDNMFKQVCTITDLSRACYTVDFSNDGSMFSLGGGDGVIRVFDITQSPID